MIFVDIVLTRNFQKWQYIGNSELMTTLNVFSLIKKPEYGFIQCIYNFQSFLILKFYLWITETCLVVSSYFTKTESTYRDLGAHHSAICCINQFCRKNNSDAKELKVFFCVLYYSFFYYCSKQSTHFFMWFIHVVLRANK